MAGRRLLFPRLGQIALDGPKDRHDLGSFVRRDVPGFFRGGVALQDIPEAAVEAGLRLCRQAVEGGRVDEVAEPALEEAGLEIQRAELRRASVAPFGTREDLRKPRGPPHGELEGWLVGEEEVAKEQVFGV